MPKTTKRSTATSRTVTTVSVGSGGRVRGVKMPVSTRSPTKRIKVVSPNRARYKSDLFESIHSSASDLRAVGAIGKQTMREYDELCIEPPRELSARTIKRLRESLNMSQPIFARRIYVSPSTVAKWESVDRSPSQAGRRRFESGRPLFRSCSLGTNYERLITNGDQALFSWSQPSDRRARAKPRPSRSRGSSTTASCGDDFLAR